MLFLSLVIYFEISVHVCNISNCYYVMLHLPFEMFYVPPVFFYLIILCFSIGENIKEKTR